MDANDATPPSLPPAPHSASQQEPSADSVSVHTAAELPSEWFSSLCTSLKEQAPALHARLIDRQSRKAQSEMETWLDEWCASSPEESLVVGVLLAGLEEQGDASLRELSATTL